MKPEDFNLHLDAALKKLDRFGDQAVAHLTEEEKVVVLMMCNCKYRMVTDDKTGSPRIVFDRVGLAVVHGRYQAYQEADPLKDVRDGSGHDFTSLVEKAN